MSKIIGNTTTTPVPRSDWSQTDKTKADFIRHKPELGTLAEKNASDYYTKVETDELVNSISTEDGDVSAENVTYENTNSGLVAENVQDAIDELKDESGNVSYDEMGDGDIPPISITQGGTGAVTAEEALANLGGMSKKLLWTNETPESGFPEQDIPLVLTDYDGIEIIWTMTKLTAKEHYSTGFLPKTRYRLSDTWYENNATYSIYRWGGISDTGVGFSTPTLNGVAKPNGGYCIPIKIYGIKGVL